MKVFLANNSKQSIGGGWTFRRNFLKGTGDKVEFVDKWEDCDIFMIMSVSAVDRGMVASAKQAGKKIVLRVDNIPKRSRNKKNPADSMRMFGELADEVIYQSRWAESYAKWLTKRDGAVIYNGVDYDNFYHNDDPLKDRKERFLFVQYNQDENKRFPEACYDFHMRFRNNPDIELWLVGLFPRGIQEHDFDFFAGEQINYIPPMEDKKKLADVMRQCKYIYFPAYNDASPNTLAEAIVCGCEPLLVNNNGGSIEVKKLHSDRKYTIQNMADAYLDIFNKLIKK